MSTNVNRPGNLSQQNFQHLMAQAPVAISILRGPQFIIELANSQILELWGKNENVIGLQLTAGLPEIKDQPFVALLQGVYNTGVTHYGHEARVTLVRDNVPGQYYFNFVYQAITDTDGSIGGIMVVATEVTEQVLSRRKLEDAEERLRLAAEATGLGTFDLDLQKGVIIHSPRLAEIFGRRSTDNISHAELRQIVLPVDLHIVIGAFDRALQTGIYFYEARVIWLDATIHWIRTTGKIIYSDNGAPLRMLGTIQDISEQKRILDDLQKSEENLRLATQAAEVGTFDLDLLNQSMVWDRRCRELFGMEDFDGPVSYDNQFLFGLHPDDKEKTDQAVNRAYNRQLSNGEYDVEYRTIGIDDKKLRWVRAKGKVSFNDEDIPQRFIGAVLDITENKLNEIRKNDFIAIASHELKTPLTSLKAYIQLLHVNARKSGDSFLLNALQKSENQINKMTKLIYGFLDLSKLESGKLRLERHEFDLNALIEEVTAENRPIAQSHTITFSGGKPIIITADREKIGQVINNFISNAVKYSPKKTDIKVSAQCLTGQVKVSIHDNGIGIKLKDQQNIFQRFYRVEDESTKGFSGFGIGLYLSAEIIELHHGKIGVDSAEGQGAEFYFLLPA
ncbi:PAS domain-containing sensor histidine kinase [Mucilaginibacter gilvus]|uniref:histidine kinase n=1 Tax=Mucilaginibacter gilvus TaxID=2305909 RepID=A0A444MSG2_9SPHI|nr:PAS domain-containing sensor histidine kinase [Mucilaginibacter gilvus]RWY55565.1 PAS domain S-box protein [Mucilaginibacter gilvus]